MACVVFLLCVPGDGVGPDVSSRHFPSAVSCTGSSVPWFMWKTTRKHKAHQKLNYFFNVFLQEPSSTMYRICLFFLNIEIALHVKYGIITCLYENSE